MANLDFDVYDGKTFREMCKDIYTRSEAKKDQLDTLFTEIRGLIKGVNEAQIFLPRLKEFLDVGIKNDEQLVKLASVVQRLQSTQLEASGGDTAGLSDEEKEQLIQNAAKDQIKAIKLEIDSPITSSTS